MYPALDDYHGQQGHMKEPRDMGISLDADPAQGDTWTKNVTLSPVSKR